MKDRDDCMNCGAEMDLEIRAGKYWRGTCPDCGMMVQIPKDTKKIKVDDKAPGYVPLFEQYDYLPLSDKDWEYITRVKSSIPCRKCKSDLIRIPSGTHIMRDMTEEGDINNTSPIVRDGYLICLNCGAISDPLGTMSFYIKNARPITKEDFKAMAPKP